MKTDPQVRFWRKVDVGWTHDCWNWDAYRDREGYGAFGVRKGKTVKAHRWAYESIVGTIPDGMEIDHICRNRGCVNPSHLEPVTGAENSRRARKSHCKRGHAMVPENYRGGQPGNCLACYKLRKELAKCAL